MNLELVSVIYGGKDSYKYTDPLNNIGTNASATVPSAPAGQTLRAIIHAHAAYTYGQYDDENFSDADKNAAIALGVPIYVTTPAGHLKKHDPSKWFFKTTTITKGLPRDPNSPKK